MQSSANSRMPGCSSVVCYALSSSYLHWEGAGRVVQAASLFCMQVCTKFPTCRPRNSPCALMLPTRYSHEGLQGCNSCIALAAGQSSPCLLPCCSQQLHQSYVTWPECRKTSCQPAPFQRCTPVLVPGTASPACSRTLGRCPQGGAVPLAGRPHPAGVQKPLQLPVQPSS